MRTLGSVGWMALLLVTGGCMGTQAGQLYNMKTGQVSTLQLDSPPSSNGAVKGNLSDGSTCQGRFSDISSEGVPKVASGAPMLTENSVASVAVVDCGPGRV